MRNIIHTKQQCQPMSDFFGCEIEGAASTFEHADSHILFDLEVVPSRLQLILASSEDVPSIVQKLNELGVTDKKNIYVNDSDDDDSVCIHLTGKVILGRFFVAIGSVSQTDLDESMRKSFSTSPRALMDWLTQDLEKVTKSFAERERHTYDSQTCALIAAALGVPIKQVVGLHNDWMQVGVVIIPFDLEIVPENEADLESIRRTLNLLDISDDCISYKDGCLILQSDHHIARLFVLANLLTQVDLNVYEIGIHKPKPLRAYPGLFARAATSSTGSFFAPNSPRKFQ